MENTNVTYTQIRGRVIRKPRSKYNFKEHLGFVIIVDLTGQAIHEDKVYMIETGRMSYSCKGVRDELKRFDKVQKVDAKEVKIGKCEELLISLNVI